VEEKDIEQNDGLPLIVNPSTLKIAMRRYKKQDECNAEQLLTLKSLRDLSDGKRISSAKQTSLDFF
jgi:hypothetical protein